MWAPCPPRDAALRILSALFGDEAEWPAASRPGSGGPGDPPARRSVPLSPFQEAGVGRLRRILGRHGGAVLADAVGLGKTFTALALIEERIRAGGDVVVLAPASLRGHWRSALSRLGRGAGRSWRLLSHTQLARGAEVRPPAGARLIVVDEAHRFRTPGTLRYRGLARIVEEASLRPGAPQLLLVTATPVNNGVRDLYHLLRLFLPDGGLRDAGVPSLRAVFDEPVPDPRAIRSIVGEVVVRRGRSTVEDRFGRLELGTRRPPAGCVFPRRAPPVLHRYADPGIVGRVAVIGSLELAAYGDGAGPLVRLSLLKRMDSSVAAFRTSLHRLRESLAAVRDAATAGRVLRPGRLRDSGDRDPFQLELVGVVADPAPPDLDLEALARSTERDLRRVDDLLGRHPDGPGHRSDPTGPGGQGSRAEDPKTASLRRLLGELRGERVLVFTEYRDTAAFLWRALLREHRVGRIDGSGAWLGPSPAGRRQVVERFAPDANRRSAPPDRERVDVLVATDVLAEGLNLQDARHVVSFDLPWNPVRLLQRIGRIDRLGSPHDLVVPHIFLPADGLDRVLGLTGRLRTKLHGITAALGGAHADELLQALATGSSGRVADALVRIERREELDPGERIRTLWAKNGRTPPGPAPRAGRAAPPAPGAAWCALAVSRPAADAGLDALALVRSPSRDRPRLIELSADGRAGPIGSAGADLLAAILEAGGPAGGDVPDRPDTERLERVRRRVLDHLAVRAAAARGPTPVPATDVAARLAGAVRAAMARAGSGLAPETVRLADTLLRILAEPLHPAREEAAARLLEELEAESPDSPPLTPAEVVAAAHGAVAPRRAPAHAPGALMAPRRTHRSAPLEPVLEGVLLVTAETG